MNIRIARTRRVLGGTFIGFVVGLLVGLGAALAVAVYVTKVPVPFVDRGLSRKPEQDAAEAEKNRGWNPNSQLGIKPAAPPPVPESSGTATAPAVTAPAVTEPKGETRDPIGELLQSRESGQPASAVPSADPYTYFVQVGAFRNQQEAESQRARVAMLGMAAEITEREQGGRTVYRVRVGPFEQRNAADATREQLAVNGVDAALVRVQR